MEDSVDQIWKEFQEIAANVIENFPIQYHRLKDPWASKIISLADRITKLYPFPIFRIQDGNWKCYCCSCYIHGVLGNIFNTSQPKGYRFYIHYGLPTMKTYYEFVCSKIDENDKICVGYQEISEEIFYFEIQNQGTKQQYGIGNIPTYKDFIQMYNVQEFQDSFK